MLTLLYAALISLFTTQIPLPSTGTLEWELGTRESIDVPGNIIYLSYFRSPDDPGPHVGHLWSANGTMIATVPFTNETPTGWQIQYLDAPMSMPAGTFTVSVNSPAGAHYAYRPGLFATKLTNGHISAPVSAGVYGPVGIYPSLSTPTGYFRDVGFDYLAIGHIVITTEVPDNVQPNPLYTVLYDFPAGTYTYTVTVDNGKGQTVTASAPMVVP